MDATVNPMLQKIGSINRCPKCGDALTAFAVACVCGHDLVNVSANRTIQELVQKFDEIEANADQKGLVARDKEQTVNRRRAQLIRDFPIPNSREDLQQLLYYIQPKIAASVKADPNAEDWRTKFTEVLNRAKNAYKDDAKTLAEITSLENAVRVSLAGGIKLKAMRNPVIALTAAVLTAATVVVTLLAHGERARASDCESAYETAASAERARLERLLVEVEGQFKGGSFDQAQLHVAGLRWEANAACRQAEVRASRTLWDNQRVSIQTSIKLAIDAAAVTRHLADATAADAKRQSEQAANEFIRLATEQKQASDAKAVADQQAAAALVATAARDRAAETKY